MKGRAPNCRCVGSGSHFEEVMKLNPVVCSESHDFQIRTATRSTTMAITDRDAHWQTNFRSVSGTLLAGCAARGGCPARPGTALGAVAGAGSGGVLFTQLTS